MSDSLTYLLLGATLGLPTLLIVRLRAERAVVLLYVYLGVLLTLGGLLGQVMSMEFTVPLIGDVVISAGSVLYGGFMSTAVMMTIITLDVSAMRRVAFLVIATNAVVAATFLIVSAALRGGVINPLDTDPALFDFSFRLLVTGGLLIIVELYALVAFTEFAKRVVSSRLVFGGAALAAFVLVVTLDGLLSFLVGLPFAPGLIDLITGGMRSKFVIGAAFALPLAGSLWLARERLSTFLATPLELQHLVVAPRDDLLERIDAAARTQQRLQDRLAGIAVWMSDGLLYCSPSGEVEAVNDAGVALLGISRDQIVGRDVGDLLGAAAPDLASMTITTAAERQVEVRVQASTSGTVVVLIDATARVERSEALARARTAEVIALDHQVEAELTKSSLLTSASHEFRTPVTVVFAAAKTLAAHRAELDSEQVTRLEDAILRHAERLNELIEDLTELGRTEAAAIEVADRRVAPVDVAAIVRQAVTDSGIHERVVVESPPVVECAVHEMAVRRIMDNLLTNVGKYAPEGPCHIVVERVDEGCRLIVTDAGPGLPTSLHDSVFDAFVRVDHDHPQPGTGIGLSLVRHLAELTGGETRIEASPVGLRVAVVLKDHATLRLDTRSAPRHLAATTVTASTTT